MHSLRSLLYLLLTLLVAAGLAGMGYWQLGRAQQKEVLLARIDAAQAAAPVPFAEAGKDGLGLAFRAVELSGEFDGAHTVLLDNQLREGQSGVRAYVPFQINGDPRAVLVDRGWLPWPDRALSPPLPAELPGQIRLSGMLLDPPGAGLQLGAAPATEWPLLTTRIDITELSGRLGRPLLDYVLEDADAPRAASIRAGMLPPERHRGYAVQWFGLALAVLAIYSVLTWRQWRRART
ncbi:MAG: SURF1 family protein [Lysobacterales bacterium]